MRRGLELGRWWTVGGWGGGGQAARSGERGARSGGWKEPKNRRTKAGKRSLAGVARWGKYAVERRYWFLTRMALPLTVFNTLFCAIIPTACTTYCGWSRLRQCHSFLTPL